MSKIHEKPEFYFSCECYKNNSLTPKIDIKIIKSKRSSTGFAMTSTCQHCDKINKNKYEFPAKNNKYILVKD